MKFIKNLPLILFILIILITLIFLGNEIKNNNEAFIGYHTRNYDSDEQCYDDDDEDDEDCNDNECSDYD